MWGALSISGLPRTTIENWQDSFHVRHTVSQRHIEIDLGMVMDTDVEKDTDKETNRHNQGHCKKTDLEMEYVFEKVL